MSGKITPETVVPLSTVWYLIGALLACAVWIAGVQWRTDATAADLEEVKADRIRSKDENKAWQIRTDEKLDKIYLLILENSHKQ